MQHISDSSMLTLYSLIAICYLTEMCDPAGHNELIQVRVNDTLLEEDSHTRTDLHSVICCNGQHKVCRDPDHRKLAICSIICGLSCIGFMSLIYSVKVNMSYYSRY